MDMTLYPGLAFSPQAELLEGVGAADTILKVSDSSRFPAPPNLATIGTDEDGETVLYTALAEGLLSGCVRGVEGAARAWQAGEVVARNFTAKDHNDLISAVLAAQGGALDARQAAEAAQSAADTAQATADTAQGAADNAQAAADTAKGAADNAQAAADNAQGAADNAQAAADNAQTTANSAVTAAAVAQSAADTAQTTANSAVDAAAAAQSAADTAQRTADSKLAPDGEAGAATVAFDPPAEREPLESGGTLSALLGRVARWLADLKAVAFSGAYADLSGAVGRPGTGTGEVFNDYRKRTLNDSGIPAAGNIASYNYAHAEGAYTTASGDSSHAEGIGTTASATASHAEGGGVKGMQGSAATAYAAHAEGLGTTASGEYSHSEGDRTIATGLATHAEGGNTVAAAKGYSHAEGATCIAADKSQVLNVASFDAANKKFTFDVTFGEFTSAFSLLAAGTKLFISNIYYVGAATQFTVASVDSANNAVIVSESVPTSNFTPTYAVNLSHSPSTGFCPHAEGDRALAMGNYGSHAEGRETVATGNYGSHAEGRKTVASGIASHTEGENTTASGLRGHAQGYLTEASGYNSHAGGYLSVAEAGNSFASGFGAFAGVLGGTALGKFNTKIEDAISFLIVGKGTSDTARANCFRVTDTGVFAAGNYASTGADYAEYFQWEDGNPDGADRVGRFVTLAGEQIRLAGPGDGFLLGVVSGAPSVTGDAHDDQWRGMFLEDVYGRPVYEERDFPAELGPDGEEIMPARRETVQALNPDYDNTQEYLPRSQRPEWAAVGMMGKLTVDDDGSCVPDGWCTAGEGGIAVRSDTPTRYRVMRRVDANHIRILIL